MASEKMSRLRESAGYVSVAVVVTLVVLGARFFAHEGVASERFSAPGEVDLGAVPAGTRISSEIVLNASSGVHRLTNIAGSCGCIFDYSDAVVLESGANVALPFAIDLSGKSGSGVATISGACEAHGREKLGTIRYRIDEEAVRVLGGVAAIEADFEPGSLVSGRFILIGAEDSLSGDLACESAANSEVEVVDLSSEWLSGDGFGVEDRVRAVDFQLRVHSLCWRLATHLNVVVSIGKGHELLVPMDLEFDSGVILSSVSVDDVTEIAELVFVAAKREYREVSVDGFESVALEKYGSKATAAVHVSELTQPWNDVQVEMDGRPIVLRVPAAPRASGGTSVGTNGPITVISELTEKRQ